MPVKKCEVCKVEFKARLSRIRTCGTQCRNQLISSERSLKYQAVKQCMVCQGDFSVGASDAKRLTCSDACGYTLRGSKTSKSVAMQCLTCGTGFLAQRSQVSQSGGGRYCSKACLYARNSRESERVCVCCGQVFTSPPSQMHVKTCSTECGYEWFSGPRRVNYIGATQRVTRPDGSVAVVQSRWYVSKKNTERRLIVTQATPAWADWAHIKAVYELAAEVESCTGMPHHVDHIVPLNSKLVCGLHNQFNLQIIPARDNLSKGNRHWPDKP